MSAGNTAGGTAQPASPGFGQRYMEATARPQTPGTFYTPDVGWGHTSALNQLGTTGLGADIRGLASGAIKPAYSFSANPTTGGQPAPVQQAQPAQPAQSSPVASNLNMVNPWGRPTMAAWEANQVQPQGNPWGFGGAIGGALSGLGGNRGGLFSPQQWQPQQPWPQQQQQFNPLMQNPYLLYALMNSMQRFPQ